ncbi:MAG: hypothetical protein ACLP50_21060 [Solirubrobacteraceae bacterium]
MRSLPGLSTGLLAPGRATRLLARLRRIELDRALAAGADPDSSRQIAARAAQLTSPGARAWIADGLERLAGAADAPAGRARVLPSRVAVRANRAALLELADVLRGGAPLYARGVAMLASVITDGTGAAYTDARGEALTRQLELARARLGGRELRCGPDEGRLVG